MERMLDDYLSQRAENLIGKAAEDAQFIADTLKSTPFDQMPTDEIGSRLAQLQPNLLEALKKIPEAMDAIVPHVKALRSEFTQRGIPWPPDEFFTGRVVETEQIQSEDELDDSYFEELKRLDEIGRIRKALGNIDMFGLEEDQLNSSLEDLSSKDPVLKATITILKQRDIISVKDFLAKSENELLSIYDFKERRFLRFVNRLAELGIVPK